MQTSRLAACSLGNEDPEIRRGDGWSGEPGLRLVGLQEDLDRDGLRQARTAGFEDDARAFLAEDAGDRVLAVDDVADVETAQGPLGTVRVSAGRRCPWSASLLSKDSWSGALKSAVERTSSDSNGEWDALLPRRSSRWATAEIGAGVRSIGGVRASTRGGSKG